MLSEREKQDRDPGGPEFENEPVTTQLVAVTKLAAPAAATMLSYAVVGLADTLMVGRLGAAELAGVGVANTILWTSGALLMGLVAAVTTLAAQHEGAGERREAGRYLHQATWVALLGGVLIAVLTGVVAKPLLSAMNPGPRVEALALSYLLIRLPGVPLLFLILARDNFLEALGDTRTPMQVSWLVNFVNIGLNAWLIFGGLGVPAMGVNGAALATCLAHLLSMAVYQRILVRRHRQVPEYGICPIERPSMPHIRKIFHVGWPMGVQFALDVGGFLVVTMFVGWMGEVAQAANQIAIRIMSLTFMSIHGVTIAATSLVGRHIGAGRLRLARRYGWSALMVALVLMFVIGLCYLIAPTAWTRLFSPEPQVYTLAALLLVLGVGFQLGDTVAMVLYGGLKGAGDTRYGMVAMVVCSWGIGLPAAYVMAFPLEMGMIGIYLGLTIQTTAASAAMIFRYAGDRWLGSIVVSRALSPDIVQRHSVSDRVLPGAAEELGAVTGEFAPIQPG